MSKGCLNTDAPGQAVGVPGANAEISVSRLVAQLHDARPFDGAAFWQQVESLGTPLVMAVAGNDQEREATFLWRSAKPLQGVYLGLNRVTDKDNWRSGLMTQVPGSDLWWLSLRLPADHRGSYRFTEVPLDAQAQVVARLGWRGAPLPAWPDPFNRLPGINGGGIGQASVVAMDRAPGQPEWAHSPVAPRGSILASSAVVADRERRIRLYLPDLPTDTALGLLVLPDAEAWIDRMHLPSALDKAVDSGRIAPFAVLGIDNLDVSDRAAILGSRRQLVRDIAERLVPGVHAAHPKRNWLGREGRVLCGQSLGGLTALQGAREASEVFGAVLAQSPSMWWTPNGAGKPADLAGEGGCWVTEHVLSAPPKKVRVRLAMGSLEGAMVPQVRQLQEGLLAAGVDSELTLYSGGHDFAWWRGAIIDGLASLKSDRLPD